jgi:hypothetical protein
MTWASLLALWSERDARYRLRRVKGILRSLTVTEADAVRAYRRTEVALLSSVERPLAVATLNEWTPPVGLA